MTPVEAPTSAVRCVIWRDLCVTDRVLCQEVLRNDRRVNVVLKFPFNNPLFPCLNELPCYWYVPAKNLGPYT